ncbi:MAG: aminoacyl-tRNA hydrolase [Planctomycetaceae bacterium]|jgi:ribosome-associated protein|nr:aminoacyl-tRNA hydrolase [Planctomycetaceae bacterium]MBT6157837.1 aminoacyl-tRNA hydrolase [Planctomycetaceae bacterium]MBT6487093.1 aminoacyl-tRNA hydrolase [Planctomycetaceae bacterium]MBT6495737.1 aminoacyl-tRNA hydrolase [Planctomycetaceae bacterium]
MNADGPSAENVLVVTRSIRIPRDEFTFTFMRSSGPGGQNVNKVNTKVRLRWDVAKSPSLSEAVRERFRKTYSRRITAEGDLLITSQRYRDQVRNIDDCLEKLRELLAAVAAPPRKRKKTRPSRASKERRLQGKREQSERKRSRRKPGRDD